MKVSIEVKFEGSNESGMVKENTNRSFDGERFKSETGARIRVEVRFGV
jgi:hypothetical protein